jgi:hypothetical protein
MAALVEANSVIIRVQAIHDRYPGGWSAFIQEVPNQTLCSDNELARIGFMTPEDCNIYVDGLEHHGIISIKNEKSVDIVVADQVRGFTVVCDWAEFGRVEIHPGQTVSAAQLKDTINRQVFCPINWKYEGSLSQQFGFVPTGMENKSLKFLRHEQGLDVYLNLVTGKEVYIGRTSGTLPLN